MLRFFALQTKRDHKCHVVRRGGGVTLDLKRVDTCAMRSEYVIMYTQTHRHTHNTHIRTERDRDRDRDRDRHRGLEFRVYIYIYWQMRNG